MRKFILFLTFIFNIIFLNAQITFPQSQDIGLPYTRSAQSFALNKIKNHIAIFSGSRYAWVKGKKVRLDDVNWKDEAFTKDDLLYVPYSFAVILTLHEFKTDTAPSYLHDRWVYTIQRPKIKFENIKELKINGRPYFLLTDIIKKFGLKLIQPVDKLYIVGEDDLPFSSTDKSLIESIITQFDTPEKFADPDIATKYIPTLTLQGKWTDHVKVSEAQKAILEGPETEWKFTPKDKYNFTGFNSKLLGSKVPPPGVYPRVLFSEQDIPMLSDRIRKSKIGQMSMIEVAYLLKHSWWDESTSDGKLFKKLYTGDLDNLSWPNDGPIPNAPPSSIPHQFKDQKPGIYNSHISYVPECLSDMALYCLLTNDQVHGKQAATAIANYFKLREPLIDEWNAASDSEMSTSYTKANGTKVFIGGNGSTTSWRNIHGVVAHMNLGLCLDFGGKWMTEEEKKIMYRVIAKATYGKRAYGQDGSKRFRDVNWVTWDLPNFLAVTSIEGQEGFDKESYLSNSETIKAFCEWGIDSSGVIYESNGKTPGGMQFHTLSMIALARRGENLWGHPHIRKLLEAQVQMTSPTGTVIVNSGTQYVPFSQQQFSLQTVNEYKSFYPNDKTADYLLAQSKTFYDKDNSFKESMREWVIENFDPEVFKKTVEKVQKLRMPSPMYPGFVHGFLYDTDYDYKITRNELKLPLDFNDPVHGVYSGFSDRSNKALWINMMVRPDHYLGAGHHHADAGMFHFSALGVDWFTESQFTQLYAGKYHNQVLVDGKSEPENEFGTGTAYQAPSKYFGITKGSSGSFASADLTNSYTYRWHTQPAPTWEKYMDSLNWEIDPSPENLKIFAGTARYKMRPWWATYNYSNYIATSRALYNPMQYVYRTTGLVRGKHGYGIIIDDLKKDENRHLFEWTAMLNGGVWHSTLDGRSSNEIILAMDKYDLQKITPTSRIIPKYGDPLLLVYVVNINLNNELSSSILKVTTEKGPNDKQGKEQYYNRLSIALNSQEAHYKVLLIPFHFGESLPEISNKINHLELLWNDGQKDQINFITSSSTSRSQIKVIRDGKIIANSQ